MDVTATVEKEPEPSLSQPPNHYEREQEIEKKEEKSCWVKFQERVDYCADVLANYFECSRVFSDEQLEIIRRNAQDHDVRSQNFNNTTKSEMSYQQQKYSEFLHKEQLKNFTKEEKQIFIEDYNELPAYNYSSQQRLKFLKKYAEAYEESYSERRPRFPLTFEQVERERKKQELKKMKTCWEEFKRFICCRGGNYLDELDEVETDALSEANSYKQARRNLHEPSLENIKVDDNNIFLFEEQQDPEYIPAKMPSSKHPKNINRNLRVSGISHNDEAVKPSVSANRSEDLENPPSYHNEAMVKHKQHAAKPNDESMGQLSKNNEQQNLYQNHQQNYVPDEKAQQLNSRGGKVDSSQTFGTYKKPKRGARVSSQFDEMLQYVGGDADNNGKTNVESKKYDDDLSHTQTSHQQNGINSKKKAKNYFEEEQAPRLTRNIQPDDEQYSKGDRMGQGQITDSYGSIAVDSNYSDLVTPDTPVSGGDSNSHRYGTLPAHPDSRHTISHPDYEDRQHKGSSFDTIASPSGQGHNSRYDRDNSDPQQYGSSASTPNIKPSTNIDNQMYNSANNLGPRKDRNNKLALIEEQNNSDSRSNNGAEYPPVYMNGNEPQGRRDRNDDIEIVQDDVVEAGNGFSKVRKSKKNKNKGLFSNSDHTSESNYQQNSYFQNNLANNDSSKYEPRAQMNDGSLRAEQNRGYTLQELPDIADSQPAAETSLLKKKRKDKKLKPSLMNTNSEASDVVEIVFDQSVPQEQPTLDADISDMKNIPESMFKKKKNKRKNLMMRQEETQEVYDLDEM